ncbi:MAG: hypothetical protein HGJ93_00645 [Desulfosarcina sp.]|nr:hypothetical protein [Desulfosarcina sp.]MBC2764494.1 hypothetical protein [Desulfosarcina sp.]
MLSRSEKLQFLELLKEKERRRRLRKIERYFPEAGPLRRDLYQKHMEFFKMGAVFRERCFMAANRVGKTEGAGGYETALHLTGKYPQWWQGRRFERPIIAWAAGDTTGTVRDILQPKLCGPINDVGTGMIPGESIIATKPRSGNVPDALESVKVQHVSGGISTLYFKSYDQKRRAFQGTEIDVILLDEESPEDIYAECLLRLMGIKGVRDSGILMLTFTPLMGLSPVVLTFMPGGKLPEQQAGSKYTVQATWDDVPHLSEKEKAEMLAAMPPHQRDARSKGIPQLGAGAIYPIPEEDISVDDFDIPKHWPKAYALDVGWNATAALWGAWDRDDDTIYLYSAYKRGQAEPPVHKEAIHARGKWIKGVCDPAAGGSSQKDGTRLIEEYNKLGLDLTPADNSVEAGIFAVWTRMSTGRLKVFKSLSGWFEEFRIYRRNEKGAVVKANDHLMDDTRYLVMSGADVAATRIPDRTEDLDDIDINTMPGYGYSVEEMA